MTSDAPPDEKKPRWLLSASRRAFVAAFGGAAAVLLLEALVVALPARGALGAEVPQRLFACLLPALGLSALLVIVARVSSRPLATLLARLPAPRARASAVALCAPSAGVVVGALSSPLLASRFPLPLVPGVLGGAALGSAVALALLLAGARARSVCGGPALGALVAVFLTGPYLGAHAALVASCLWLLLVVWLLWLEPSRAHAAVVGALALLSIVAGAGTRAGDSVHPSAESVVAAGFYTLNRALVDLDADGASPLFGGGDCDDLDPTVGPRVLELVHNGVDDNCIGGDLASPGDLSAPVLPASVSLERPRNVVLISVDTLRADHVGKQVDGRSLTPNIDALLADSVVFERAFSAAGYTSASLLAALTSTPVTSYVLDESFLGLEASITELLRLAGYQNVAVLSLPQLVWYLTVAFDDVDMRAVDPDAGFRQRPAQRTTELALEHAARLDRGSPFLFWVHYMDPHIPYLAHPEGAFLGDDTRGRYAQEVHHVDAELGKLLDGLDGAGLLDDAIVVFLADHGEMLGEDGLQEHALHLRPEVLHVPLAVRVPGVPARRVTTPVSLLDLAPTLMDLLGGSPSPLWRGRSLASALHGGKLDETPLFFAARYDPSLSPLVGVLEWPWLYVEEQFTGAWSLHRAGDGDEAPPDRRALRERLGAFVDRSLNDAWLARKSRHYQERNVGLRARVQGEQATRGAGPIRF